MLIPEGFAQINILMGGVALPTGAQVTFGVDHTGDAGNPDAVATEIATRWELDVMPILSQDVELQEVRVKFGPNDVGPIGQFAGTAVGGLNSAAIEPNSTILVRKLTAFGGRTGRGRMYVPGLGDLQVDSAGNILSSPLSIAQAAFTDLLTSLDAGGLPMFLLHDEDSPVSTPLEVTSLSVDTKIATQRRRLRR